MGETCQQAFHALCSYAQESIHVRYVCACVPT